MNVQRFSCIFLQGVVDYLSCSHDEESIITIITISVIIMFFV